MSSFAKSDSSLDAVRDALRALGYIEGQNIKIAQRSAEQQVDRLPQPAEELVRMGSSVILAVNEATLRAAKQATSTIPIVVIAYDHDPVASGLIDSLSRPGGNVTGIFSRQIDLVGKRLELLKETVPGISRVAVFHDVSSRRGLADLQVVAKQLSLQLQPVELADPNTFARSFKLARRRADAATVLFSPMLYEQRARIASLAVQMGLPTMSQTREFVVAGALMSYAPDRAEVAGRTAYFIDRLLRGAKPSELPVERASKFKLSVNLKTAKALGMKIPQLVLVRADEVIR